MAEVYHFSVTCIKTVSSMKSWRRSKWLF